MNFNKYNFITDRKILDILEQYLNCFHIDYAYFDVDIIAGKIRALITSNKKVEYRYKWDKYYKYICSGKKCYVKDFVLYKESGGKF